MCSTAPALSTPPRETLAYAHKGIIRGYIQGLFLQHPVRVYVCVSPGSKLRVHQYGDEWMCVMRHYTAVRSNTLDAHRGNPKLYSSVRKVKQTKTQNPEK